MMLGHSLFWVLLQVGFCRETEEEHEDTLLSLIIIIGYDIAYMFAYSMREKTHANRNYSDDVLEGVEQRRLTLLIEAFCQTTGDRYGSQLGSVQLVLVEGSNKRALGMKLIGQSDRGHRGSFVNVPVAQRECDSNRASSFGKALDITKLRSFYNV